MRGTAQMSFMVGEVVAAAFDEAERYSADPDEVSLLATHAVAHMLRRRVPAASGKQEVRGAIRIDAAN